MKKLIIIFAIIVVCLTSTKKAYAHIPDEAIRIRIIPNSNSEIDQNMKLQVKNYLEPKLYDLLKNVKGVNDARNEINFELPTINEYINELFKNNNYNMTYELKYGLNYFPKKEYNGVQYSEGYYESLVVTIGEGKGDNWWCVLFPPLCLLEAEETNENNKTEYKFFVQELINKYL